MFNLYILASVYMYDIFIDLFKPRKIYDPGKVRNPKKRARGLSSKCYQYKEMVGLLCRHWCTVCMLFYAALHWVFKPSNNIPGYGQFSWFHMMQSCVLISLQVNNYFVFDRSFIVKLLLNVDGSVIAIPY